MRALRRPIGFAPARDPKIAFAVLVEYGGSGGKDAGPVAQAILEACIEHGYLSTSAKPHQTSLTRPPTPGLRDWRTQMSPEEIGAFDRVAVDLLGVGAERDCEAREERWEEFLKQRVHRVSGGAELVSRRP